MKIHFSYLFFIPLLLASSLSLYSQPTSPSQNFFVFRTTGTFQGVQDDQVLWVPDNALYKVFETIDGEDIQAISPLLLGVKFEKEQPDTKGVPVRYLAKSYSSHFISDSSETEVIAMGVDETNVPNFRYRVVENDSNEIVPWSAIPALDQNYGAKKPYAVLGRFRSPGKQLLIEVKHVSDYSQRDGVIFDWRAPKAPQLQQIAVFWRDSGKTSYAGLATTNFYESIDPQSQIPHGFRFERNVVSNIQLFFEDHYDIPYSVVVRRLSVEDSAAYPLASAVFEKTFQIHEQHFSVPGSYELIINRSVGYGELPVADALRIPFEVLPGTEPGRKVTVELVIVFSTILFLIFVGAFILYYRRQRRKLKHVALQNEIAAIELKSFRNQLNPHFMFNALSSIQNLISNGLTEKANAFIVKFSLLTRQLLENSDREAVSLQEEIELMRNYLFMEQLRFNFRFSIMAEGGLEMDNIEIPTMLLQPLIENAVKHGVSALAEKGLIDVRVRAAAYNLVIEIDDNGPGFPDGKSEGYGLGLTRQRINMLNRSNADQAISLSFSRLEPGTRAAVTFKNWML